MLEDLLICQHCGTSAQPMISPGMGGAGRGGKGGGGGSGLLGVGWDHISRLDLQMLQTTGSS